MAFWNKRRKKIEKEDQSSRLSVEDIRSLINKYEISIEDKSNLKYDFGDTISFIEDSTDISVSGIKKYRTQLIKSLFNSLQKKFENDRSKLDTLTKLASEYGDDIRGIIENFKKVNLSEEEKNIEALLWICMKYSERDLIEFDIVVKLYNDLRVKTSNESKTAIFIYKIYKTFETMQVNYLLFIDSLRKGLMRSYMIDKSKELDRVAMLITTILQSLDDEYKFDDIIWSTIKEVISGKINPKDLIVADQNIDDGEIITVNSSEINKEVDENIDIKPDVSHKKFELILKMSESMRVINHSSEFEMLLLRLLYINEKYQNSNEIVIHTANGTHNTIIVTNNNVKEVIYDIKNMSYINYKFSNVIDELAACQKQNKDVNYIIIFDKIIDKLNSKLLFENLVKETDITFNFIQLEDNEDYHQLTKDSQVFNNSNNVIMLSNILNDNLLFINSISTII